MTGPRPISRRRVAEWALASAVVAAATVASTWPLATSPWLVPAHQDPLFSAWRLYTWARSLAGQTPGLFDANIFYPATGVQLLSDPILLPAIVTTPLIWAGLPPVLGYALVFWGSTVASGLAMYACARAISGSRWGALVAAAMFTGAPARLEHVIHLESLWTPFLPLAVLATVRAFEGRPRAPLALGAAMVGQIMGGIYFGVFLFTLWPILAGVEWLRRRGAVPRPAVVRTLAGVAVAAILVAIYAAPFARARRLVGDRGEVEVTRYSASLASYATSPAANRVWGWTDTGRAETRLFPGLLGTGLAAGALAAPAAPWVAALAVTTAVAVDASRGVDGWTYPWLRLLSPYRGLRVPARFGMLALMGLALLAAVGTAQVLRVLSAPAAAAVVVVAILAGIVAESAAVVPVRRMPRSAPPVYAWLSTLPPTVIAHLPMPRAAALPGPEADYQYFAQYHRHALLNGYSGFYPPDYLRLIERASGFPDDRALEALRAAGAKYLLVHEAFYPSVEAFEAVVDELERRDDVTGVLTSADEGGTVRVYRLR
ncbi:MAG: hypothetical protein AB7O93_12370 [Vicinamibacterales bacterium]